MIDCTSHLLDASGENIRRLHVEGARPGQIDAQVADDTTRTRREHHNAVREKDSLRNAVRDHDGRAALRQPESLQVQIDLVASRGHPAHQMARP